MKEGPFSRGETDRLSTLEHRQSVVDPAVDDIILPALENYFGPAVIDDPADRAALEAKLAEKAATRERIRNSVPATLAMLAAAREGERNQVLAPIAPIHPFVEQAAPTFEQYAEQYVAQQPQAYEGRPPMPNAA